MKIISIKIKTFLLKDIDQRTANKAVTAFIDTALCMEASGIDLHKRNILKPYSFSGLAPVEKNGRYMKDSICTIILRTLDINLAEYLAERLPHAETDMIKGLTCDASMIYQGHIQNIYTLTPVIIRSKDNKGYWKGSMSFEQFQHQIKVNLIKKYNHFQKTEIDEAFLLWNNFELINQKPVAFPYKNIMLLGDKIDMQISDDPRAQDLAYMALATGLGEINSRGAGYVNFHKIKEG